MPLPGRNGPPPVPPPEPGPIPAPFPSPIPVPAPEPTPPSVPLPRLSAADVLSAGSPARSRASAGTVATGATTGRSGLRLLFRRRRLYRLRHGRGIRRRLGPRLCLGALDDALGDDRASHPARALKLGTRRRRGLLQTAAPAPSARSGRRQEHQTGGVEPLRPRDDWCGPDKERKGAENHRMGQRRCSQRHTSFPMLRQRGLKQVPVRPRGTADPHRRALTTSTACAAATKLPPIVGQRPFASSARTSRTSTAAARAISFGVKTSSQGDTSSMSAGQGNGKTPAVSARRGNAVLPPVSGHFRFDRTIGSRGTVLLHRQRARVMRTLGEG